jgi:hypothetical protein
LGRGCVPARQQLVRDREKPVLQCSEAPLQIVGAFRLGSKTPLGAIGPGSFGIVRSRGPCEGSAFGGERRFGLFEQSGQVGVLSQESRAALSLRVGVVLGLGRPSGEGDDLAVALAGSSTVAAQRLRYGI